MQYVNIFLFFVEVHFLIVISLRWEREVTQRLKSNMSNAWMLG